MFGLDLPLARSGVQSLRILLFQEAFPADWLHFWIIRFVSIVADRLSYQKILSFSSKWPDCYPNLLGLFNTLGLKAT